MCNTGPLAKRCLLLLDIETRKGNKMLWRCSFWFCHPSLTGNSSGKLLYTPEKLNSRFKDGLMNSLLFFQLAMELSRFLPDPGSVGNVNLKREPPGW